MDKLVVTKEQLQEARIQYLAAINIYARMLNVRKEGDYTHFPKELVDKMLPNLEADATKATEKYQTLNKQFKARFGDKIVQNFINTKDILIKPKAKTAPNPTTKPESIDIKSLLKPANAVGIKLSNQTQTKPIKQAEQIMPNDLKDLLRSA